MSRLSLIRRSLLTLLLASMALMPALTGCRSHKQAAATATQQGAVTTAPAGNAPSQASIEADFASLAGACKEWKSVKIPVTVNVTAPISQKIGGTLTMVHGQGIELSLRMLGLEVAKMMIDADSLHACEKLRKSLVAEPLRRLTAGTGITVADAQALLLGRPFCPGGNLTAANFTLSGIDDPSGEAWTMAPHSKGLAKAGVELVFVAMGSRLGGLAAWTDNADKRVTVEYGTPTITPAGPVAGSLTISVEGLGKPLAATITLNLAKAKWNTGLKALQWQNPKNYRRIDASKLPELLSGL